MRAVLSAAPTPVVMAHPMSASCSAGRSVCTVTSDISGTVIMSAKPPSAANAVICSPFLRTARGVAEWVNVSSQRCVCPRTQQ
ncbi:unannotated protein [freshwater metagenome]|uniref:Unannotated protein n=1 Tax=freshwater metagenome TaxID=449393 RepID=A0A6J7AU41_9ZZZZ